MDHRLVEDVDTPNVVANAVIEESREIADEPPIRDVLDELGVRAAFRLLTTGEIGAPALARYAEDLVSESAVSANQETPPDDNGQLLTDSDWIALQQICER